MKKNIILIGAFSIFFFACQTSKETPEIPEEVPEIPEIPGYDISKLGIDIEDAKRELCYEPTGEVYVDTVKIDFGLTELFEYRIKTSVKMEIHLRDFSINITERNFEGDIHAVSTLGRLVYIYQKFQPYFVSYRLSESRDCDYILPKLEYSLAQQCFQDSCSSITRKAVLHRAIDIQEFIFEDKVIIGNSHAIRSNIFLMAVILAKENDAAFMAAVSDNKDLQIVLRAMNAPISLLFPNRELSDYVKQFAIDFLSNQ